MARISTGTGDEGTTGLVGGERVAKTHPRVEACGTIDEVNDLLGLTIAFVDDETLVQGLRRIQEDLFTLGADVASPQGEGMRITGEHVAHVEGWSDELEVTLPPLTKFILPGGLHAAAFLQLARSVTRRAERTAWRIREDGGTISPDALVYLNRLSDLLFLLARKVNLDHGIEEPEWRGRAD